MIDLCRVERKNTIVSKSKIRDENKIFLRWSRFGIDKTALQENRFVLCEHLRATVDRG